MKDSSEQRRPFATFDYQALTKWILAWIPESLSPAYAGKPEHEAAAIRTRINDEASRYIAERIQDETHRFVGDALFSMKDKLQDEARVHALRQVIGDTTDLDEMLRYSRHELQKSLKSRLRRWVTMRRGRPPKMTRREADAERARLREEIEAVRQDLRNRGLPSSEAEALEEIAENRETTASVLGHILHPRRSTKKKQGSE